MESLIVKGIDLEKMPHELKIIAALVKRLGGEVMLSEKEISHENFTGVTLQLGYKRNTMVIKAE